MATSESKRWLTYFLGLSLLIGALLLSCDHPAQANPSSLTLQQWLVRQQLHDDQLQHRHEQQNRVNFYPVADPVRPLAGTVVAEALPSTLRLRLNTANAAEIQAKLDGIGPKKAQAIISYRNQHGSFKSVDELLNVQGIGQKTLDKNRHRLSID